MDRNSYKRVLAASASILLLLNAALGSDAQAYGRHDRASRYALVDAARKIVRIGNGDVRFCVKYDGRCLIDSLWVGSTLLSGTGAAGFTGLRIDSTWHTTHRLVDRPVVSISGDSVGIANIRYSVGKDTIYEVWSFVLDLDEIVWTIRRTLPKPLLLEENAFPRIRMDTMAMFDGALLGNGGNAWFRLFNDSAVAYGVHTDETLFWAMRTRQCLRLLSRSGQGKSTIALSRNREALECTFSAAPGDLSPRFDAGTHRRRFIRGRTDVWGAFPYPAGTYMQTVRISAPDFQERLGRGEFKGMDGVSITALLNTTARLGVIDSKLFGGNSWHTPYGPICIHEQYIAQFGLSINDPSYTKGYQECLDYYRDHAIQSDGRIKSRWAYTNEDAIPGSADSLGFYEAQWGILMDSQPDFVINVAELFDQCGDLAWLRSHKQSCEKVLDYVLQRDSDSDYLVEMMTDSHVEARGSDWLDIVWASWENAFVNAEVYWALTLWSDLEDLMGDRVRADSYRRFAAGLKESYNRSTAEGGFWDESHRWYVHWREKDGSVYGNNLVTPVNFMAIGYGLCDDRARKLSILTSIDAATQKENLFFWPVCVFPYEPGTVHQNNLPYPNYENGDLFLSWGELGVRAYAEEFPEIALRYVKNVLRRYEEDGLAFQRYLRTTQEGSGDDILAGNASAVTGLYRNIYGIQPRHNRLQLRPRLVGELYGTRLRYAFRGRDYWVTLNGAINSVTVDGTTVSAPGDFGIMREGPRTTWHGGTSALPTLVLTVPDTTTFSLTILEWTDRRSWTLRSYSERVPVIHEIAGLRPSQDYVLTRDGYLMCTLHAGDAGTVEYTYLHDDNAEHTFALSAIAMPEHLRREALFSLVRPALSPGDTIAISPGAIQIRMSHETPGALIRYTLDGSDPTEQSAVYSAPFAVTGTTVVKARAYRAGMSESGVASATYTIISRDFRGIVRSGGKVYAYHKALHRKVSLAHLYQAKYPASGDNALTDGVLGGASYGVHWQGFESDDLEATIDLGAVMPIDTIRVGFLQDQRSWIFFPLEVAFSVSADGRNFVPLAPLQPIEHVYGGELMRRDYVYGGNVAGARYVRVRATNQGVCPPGHPGAGGKAWLFADEIVVQ